MWLLHGCVVRILPENFAKGAREQGRVRRLPRGAAPQKPLRPADRRPRPQSRRKWSPAPRMCAKLWAGLCSCAARSSEAARSASPRPCGASKGSCCLRRHPSPSPPRPPTTPSCASTPSPATAAAATSAASPTTWARLSVSSRSRVRIQWVPPHIITPTWAHAPPQFLLCPHPAWVPPPSRPHQV